MKAFDIVPHCSLVAKAEAHSIKENVLQWIQDFLSHWSQWVCVNGVSDIPQCSVIGPGLFLMYINDLPWHVQSHVRLFADDTKIFARSNVDVTMTTLQDNLDRLREWSMNRQMWFRLEKTFALMSNQERKCQRMCDLLNALVTPKETSRIVGVSLKTVYDVNNIMTMSKAIMRRSGSGGINKNVPKS
ncbi:uncharacterized protein LOC115225677 [Octopus sinensis]|uniref:Uncharacterized protein LOC115225677 n=1 Tax=Octopus sinensis TaxID=2607531 RepID=A0A6P7TLP8_9MOLL|nr:uncharacterized protein LOC115225677 [Octopus sinensis]